MASYDIVLLDVEGTTTPISFVHDVLFPYITNNVSDFLASNWNDPMLQTHIRAIADQANLDAQSGISSAIPIDLLNDTPEEIRSKTLANIDWQMKSDRKIGALKGLQGFMWQTGYKNGQLLGAMFQDAVIAIKRWCEKSRSVYIYSSGSVEAQKLIFGYSDHGDLSELLSGHYDTKVGAKIESQSYLRIAGDIGVVPGRVLFVSDNVLEIRAASEAGMQTVVSVRPGNAPIPESELGAFKTVTDFMEIPL
ncbi:enolase-phosphatase E1 [Kickxella alabastrina]|nr:enolase-phosphatase E1 [Kickxella alabastrina]